MHSRVNRFIAWNIQWISYYIILTRCAPVGSAEVIRGLLEYFQTIAFTPIGSIGIQEDMKISDYFAGSLESKQDLKTLYT